MAEFPRSNLNPSAAPWGRQVEALLRDYEKTLTELQQTMKSQGRFVSAGKGNGYADGSIYRENGIVVPVSAQDFTMFSADDIEDDASRYGSVNVQPGYVALRTQNNVNNVITDLQSGLVRLGPTTFELGWDVLDPHEFVAQQDQDTPVTRHKGFFYGWRSNDVDYSRNMRGLVIGNGLISFDEFTDANQHVFTQMVLGDWIRGDLNVDGNGIAHPTLTLFGGHVLNADGTGIGADAPTIDPASHTARGVVQLATTAQIQGGTDDTTAVTPKGVKAAIDFFAPSGGTGTGGGGTAHPLPQATFGTPTGSTLAVDEGSGAYDRSLVVLSFPDWQDPETGADATTWAIVQRAAGFGNAQTVPVGVARFDDLGDGGRTLRIEGEPATGAPAVYLVSLMTQASVIAEEPISIGVTLVTGEPSTGGGGGGGTQPVATYGLVTATATAVDRGSGALDSSKVTFQFPNWQDAAEASPTDATQWVLAFRLEQTGTVSAGIGLLTPGNFPNGGSHFATIDDQPCTGEAVSYALFLMSTAGVIRGQGEQANVVLPAAPAASGGGGASAPLATTTAPSTTTDGWVRNGDAQWGDLSSDGSVLTLTSSYDGQFVRYAYDAGRVPAPIDMAPAEFTCDMLIPSSAPWQGMSAGIVLSNDGDAGHLNFRLDANDDGTFGCRFEQDGQAAVTNSPGAVPFTLDTWHTIRFVRRGRSAVAYIDGTYVLGTDGGPDSVANGITVMMYGGHSAGAQAQYRNLQVVTRSGL